MKEKEEPLWEVLLEATERLDSITFFYDREYGSAAMKGQIGNASSCIWFDKNVIEHVRNVGEGRFVEHRIIGQIRRMLDMLDPDTVTEEDGKQKR